MFKILKVIRKVLGKITDVLDMGREQGWWDKKKLVLMGLILSGTVYAADMSKVELVTKNLDALVKRGGKVAAELGDKSPKEAINLNVLAYNKYVIADQEVTMCKQLKDSDSFCDNAQRDIDDANDYLTRALTVIHEDKSIL